MQEQTNQQETFFIQHTSAEYAGYTVIIEDDGQVAYAYLLKEQKIVGDVWLYNALVTPDEVDWNNQDQMPYLNPAEYVAENHSNLRHSLSQLSYVWDNSSANLRVRVYIESILVAILIENELPGWSLYAKEDGPLARPLI